MSRFIKSSIQKPLIKRLNKSIRRAGFTKTFRIVTIITLIFALPLTLSVALKPTVFQQKAATLEHDQEIELPNHPFIFGTLLSDSTKALQEKKAGIDAVELEMGWDAYEPSENFFNSSYIQAKKEELRRYQEQGLKVVLGIGLQYPPSWVFTYPNSLYKNQYGQELPHVVNLTFNKTLREKAQIYIDHVSKDLGFNNFWAIRVGSGGYIETLYPGETEMNSHNSYWAYDSSAQGQEEKYPLFLSKNPFPGWKPGDRIYQNKPFSLQDVTQWYDWYVTALADGVNWQIWMYRSHGFNGFIQILMPGQGVRPTNYIENIKNYLTGKGDINWTMGRGAVWNKIIDKINNKSHIVAYVSSLADGSGNDDLCLETDKKVSLLDTQINDWSATRWISYIANKYHIEKNGENPGRPDTNSYGYSMMEKAALQMRSCGFQGMMWAHDEDLYNNDSGISLVEYAHLISTSQH